MDGWCCCVSILALQQSPASQSGHEGKVLVKEIEDTHQRCEREKHLFLFFFGGGVVILTSGSVCQDRLGTNEGKVEAKRRVFPQGFRRRSRGRRAVRVSCCYSSSFAIQLFGPTLLRNCRVFVLSRACLCQKRVCLKLSRETSGDH